MFTLIVALTPSKPLNTPRLRREETRLRADQLQYGVTMQPSDIVALVAVIVSGIVGLGGIGGTIWGVHRQAETSARAKLRADQHAAYVALLNYAHQATDRAATSMSQIGVEYAKYPQGEAPPETEDFLRAWRADADQLRRAATDALVRCNLAGGENMREFTQPVLNGILATTSTALRGEDPMPAIKDLTTAAISFQCVAEADLGYPKETPRHLKRKRLAERAARALSRAPIDASARRSK